MTVARVGINGGGRIGRMIVRCVLDAIAKGDRSVEIVAINDLKIDPTYMAYLIKHDSTHGQLRHDVRDENGTVKIGDVMSIKMFKEGDPSKIPWASVGAEYVVESTGIFTKVGDASKHIAGGAKKVVISAPSEDAPMFVMGVNNESYDPKTMHVVSNASCTTNCLAPLVKVVNDKFTLVEGLMSTVHAMTATQTVVDGPSAKDWRGGRSAADNIVPSSTGAAKAVGKIIPSLNGKLTGMAFRVPVHNVSVVDLTCRLETPVTSKMVDDAVKAAAEGPMKGIITSVSFPAVSSDFNTSSYSSVYDSTAFCSVSPDKPCHFVKLVSWYDNEYGYSTRMVDLIRYMSQRS